MSSSSLGVMVGGAPNSAAPNGAAPITYHFTFHSDERVYFDLAPDAPLPAPKIPTTEESHFHEGGHDLAGEQMPPVAPVTTAVFVAAAPVTTTQPTTVSTDTAVPAMTPTATPLPFDTPPSRPSPLFILLLAAGGGISAGYLTQRFYEWLTGRKDAPATPTDIKDGR